MASLSRAEAITLAVDTLTGLGAYGAVVAGVPDELAPVDAQVMVYGQGMAYRRIARAKIDTPIRLAAVVTVRYDRGDPAAAEVAIADLILASLEALHAVGFLELQSDAGGGVPNRVVDGQSYRAERITMTWET